MSAIPAETALLAIGLLNYADDEGFFNANPKLVHAALFPLRELSVKLPVMLQELSAIGFIQVRTDAEGRHTGVVVNFENHQVISHPKKSTLRLVFEGSNGAAGSLPESSGNDTGGLLSGMEGNGREQGTGKGTGKGTGNAQARGRVGKTGIDPAKQDQPLQERLVAIGSLLRRQPGTVWTAEEFEAFKAAGLEQLSDADFATQVEPMRAFYGAAIPRENDFRRRDVLRLLRYWPGELDKARAWVRDNDSGLKKM